MRVTSSLWVSAYIRRCFSEGAMAAQLRKGAEEAGAIFVVVDRLDGTSDLYGPAPQTDFDDARPSERLFRPMLTGALPPDISAKIESEARFDPDLWVVSVEDREGRCFLDLARDDDGEGPAGFSFR